MSALPAAFRLLTLYHVCTLQPCAPLTIIMPWLEWCPERPDAQRVKIFHPGSWTPQDERDDPPPRHTYREWKEFYAPNHAQDGDQPTSSTWYKRDWTTEGYRRVAAPEPDHGFNSMSSPDQHNVATQSSALCLSTQILNGILRSSDASAFSTEDLTRLQAGICQQLSDRARQASHHHQQVRTSRGVEPPESIGVADPYLPASQPCSSTNKEKPSFELVAE